MPIRIDPPSLKKMGRYSRILVDVDCSRKLPERVLVQRKHDIYKFYATLFYEFVPFYYHHCCTLGHKEDKCRRMGVTGQQENIEPSRPWCSIEQKKNGFVGDVSNVIGGIATYDTQAVNELNDAQVVQHDKGDHGEVVNSVEPVNKSGNVDEESAQHS